MKGPLTTWPCAIHGNELHGELVGFDKQASRGLCLSSGGWLQRIPAAQIRSITLETAYGRITLLPCADMPPGIAAAMVSSAAFHPSLPPPPSFFSEEVSQA